MQRKSAPRHQISTVADVIGCWPSIAHLARDLNISYWTVAAWKRRRFIPHRWWQAISVLAKRHGISRVTYSLLRDIAAANEAQRSRPSEIVWRDGDTVSVRDVQVNPVRH